MRNDTEEMANDKIPEPQSPEEKSHKGAKAKTIFYSKGRKGRKDGRLESLFVAFVAFAVKIDSLPTWCPLCPRP
jgi:hypothetical protein